jgi:hypothetical protein
MAKLPISIRWFWDTKLEIKRGKANLNVSLKRPYIICALLSILLSKVGL